MSQLRLTIDSDLKHVFLVALTVNKVCEHLQIDSVQAYAVELCTVEALTNAIRHAYRSHRGHEVSLTISIGEDKLDLEVCDSGMSMSAEQVARLHRGSRVFEFDPANLASLPEGGMGLDILHEGMDEAAYTSEGRVNRLRLTKFLRPRERPVEAQSQTKAGPK